MSARERIRCGYCGPSRILPSGWDYNKSPYECLKSGIGAGTHKERRKWQYDMGYRVDPEYHSPCPRRNYRRIRRPVYDRSRSSYIDRRRRRSRSRSSGRSRSRNRSFVRQFSI